MPNQKGSIKDRLRARFIFLKYKKNKKIKEKEILKKKKKLEKERIKSEQIRLYGRSYNKFQIFGLTSLGLLLELLTPKNSKTKVETKIDIIEKEIGQIVLKLESDKDLNHIAESIESSYEKLENLKKEHKNALVINSFSSKKRSSIIQRIDKKQKELHVLNDVCKSRKQEKNNNEILKHVLSTDKLSKTKNLNKQNDIKNVGGNLTQNKAHENIKSNDNKNIKPEPITSVKVINEQLKAYEKEIIKVTEKIEEEKAYSALYDYEFKLKQLKIRINKLLEQYEILDEKYELEKLEEIIDIDVLDKFELRKDNKKILNQFEVCENLLAVIEEKKEILSTNKKNNININQEHSNKEVTNDIKSEQDKNKKKENKKVEKEFNDLYLASKMVMDNISKEKKIIDKLKRQISVQSPVVRKRSIFTSAKRFTASIVNFGFSMLPFRFFKNRFIGTLTTGLMLNNSLRSVRRIFSHDVNYLFYQDLLREIKVNSDYVKRTYDICSDSLIQIKSIRNHLDIHYSSLNEYNIELMEFYNELDTIENRLVSQISELENIELDYKNIKKKIKIKE